MPFSINTWSSFLSFSRWHHFSRWHQHQIQSRFPQSQKPLILLNLFTKSIIHTGLPAVFILSLRHFFRTHTLIHYYCLAIKFSSCFASAVANIRTVPSTLIDFFLIQWITLYGSICSQFVYKIILYVKRPQSGVGISWIITTDHR